MTNEHRARMLECTMAYIARDWRVLPLCYPRDGQCTCGRNEDCSPGKAPHFVLAPHGSKDATTDEATIKEWFASSLDFNIGICAGAESGLVILDIDPQHGGNESLDKCPATITASVITGSGGAHLYFNHPGGDIRNSAGKLGKGLDVRGHNGYVAAPPSLHPCGKEYRWSIDPKAIIDCPAWITSGKKRSRKATGGKIPPGERNNALASLAGSMRRAGASEAEIYTALCAFNDGRCNPPIDDGEIRQIAGSVANYDPEPEDDAGDKIMLPDDHPDTVAEAFRKNSPVQYRYNAIDGFSIYHQDKYQVVENESEIEAYLRPFIQKCRIRKRTKQEDGSFKKTTQRPDKRMKTPGYVTSVVKWLRDNSMVHLRPSQRLRELCRGH